MRILVLGGVRSGKSARGEELLAGAGRVRYAATGRPTDGDPADTDPNWRQRVDAHRARRGDRYQTVETTDLVAILTDSDPAPILIDDLGNWLTSLFDDANGWDDADFDPAPAIDRLTAAIAAYPEDAVLVSPEVGFSVVPPTPSGRRFQDALGALNVAVAQVCERVELVVAGRVLELPAGSDAVIPPKTIAAVTDPVEAERAAEPVVATPIPEPIAVGSPVLTCGRELSGVDAELFGAVEYPSPTVGDQARARQLELTKPPGSLGRLEELGNWIAACQEQCPPRKLRAPVAVVFAGDHGVAREGVSAFPPEVTAQMVANMAAGGAAINVLGRNAGASVFVVDMSVEIDTTPEVSRYKVRRSTGDLRTGQAMSLAEARLSLAAGRACADELIDSGADLLIAGDMGIGNTTPTAVLVGTLTDREPVEVVGRGTGIDDAGWIRKTAAIRDGMWAARRYRNEPLSLLAAVAGPDLAAMAGFLAQAAVRKTPAILDGSVVTSAALVAEQLAPGASQWWRAGHRSTEPAHGFALDKLGLTPIVDLSLRLGEGSGAMTALPVVHAAVDILAEMATFADAGVSGA